MRSERPPVLAISLLSGAALGYEVLLLRLFSIIQWHHFAYMIISLALLGYGVSGTLLAVLGRRVESRFALVFGAGAALFGPSALAAFAIAQRIPFNPLELAWDPVQPVLLAAVYLILAVPFLFAATAIGLALIRFRDSIGRLYGADLLGAGIGALAVLGLLAAFSPEAGLRFVGALGPAAAAVALVRLRGVRAVSTAAAALLAVAVAVAVAAVPSSWLELHPSPYKDLSQALRVLGARAVTERPGPLGLITVVENRQVPFRYAPGLSLNSPSPPPEQLALFVDGNAAGAINRLADDGAIPAYLDYLTSALPYRLRDRPRVLVLGAGGGTHVLQALLHDATTIDAVELDPRMIDLVRLDHAGFAGHVYERGGVRLHAAEARAFSARDRGTYDVIQLALVGSSGASAAGLHALNEDYLYTVESFELLIERLAPSGLLTVTRWEKLPPRDGPRLLATLVRALERRGVTDAANRIAWIRGWNTSTLVVKNAPLEEIEIEKVRAFAHERSFDLAWLPGLAAAEANRTNILDRPYFFEAATALLGPDARQYVQQYKYDIAPATDDRPYYFNFFRWRLVPELAALRGRGGVGLVEWGYPVLVLALVQAAIASVVLVPLPLLAGGARLRRSLAWPHGLRVLAYFFALGLAFLFLEIAFLQKFVLILGHPVYAAAAVLSGFLVFAGAGSVVSSRLAERRNPVLIPVAGVAMIALGLALALPFAVDLLTPLPLAAKGTVSLILIAPLAFCMGMPFPLGLARLGREAPDAIPWAWAINGCASVLSAVLATLLAIHFGFVAVVTAAVALYGLAALTFPSRPASPAAPTPA